MSVTLCAAAIAMGCSPRDWNVPLQAPYGGAGAAGGVGGGHAGAPASGGGGPGGSTGSGGEPMDGGPRPMGKGGQGGGGPRPTGMGGSKCDPVKLTARSPAILILTDRSAKTNVADDQGVPWWRGENDAIKSAVGSVQNTKFGYRPFPLAGQGCGGSMDNVYPWTGMLTETLNACASNATCATSSMDVPLAQALDAITKDFAGNLQGGMGGASNFKQWLIVLLGSQPGCGANPCSPQLGRIYRAGIDVALLPFGSDLLDAGNCLASLQVAITSLSLSPVALARTGDELASNLQKTVKAMVAQTQCTFWAPPTFPYLTPDSLRVIGAQGNTVTEPLTKPNKGWDSDDGVSFQIQQPYCGKIIEALARGPVTVLADVSYCPWQ